MRRKWMFPVFTISAGMPSSERLKDEWGPTTGPKWRHCRNEDIIRRTMAGPSGHYLGHHPSPLATLPTITLGESGVRGIMRETWRPGGVVNDATELAAGRPFGAVLNKAKKEENQTIDHHHYGRKLNGLPLCSFISPISSQRLHYLLMLAMQADLQQKMT